MKMFLYRLYTYFKNILSSPAKPPKPNSDTIYASIPWLEVARKELGVKESIVGLNSRISAYFRVGCGYSDTQKTSWCSAFINFVMHEAGCKRTKKATAKSWLDIGLEVLDKPKHGCIVVFDRPSTPAKWDGHVALFDQQYDKNAPKYITVLGGNQSNAVRYSNYKRADVVAYLWPKAQ